MEDSNIGSVCFPFIGDSVGGSHRSTTILIEELRKTGIDSLVILHHQGPLAKYLSERNIDFEYLPLPTASTARRIGNPLAYIISAYRIYSFVSNSSFQIVHGNDARVHNLWVLPTRLAGKLYIWHQRTKYSKSILSNSLLNLVTLVVSISNYVMESLPSKDMRDSIVVNNPLGNFTTNQSRLCRTLTTEKRISVGFIGALNRQKRPLEFLDIAEILVSSGIDRFDFLMVGKDGDYSVAELEQIADSKGLTNRLQIVGNSEHMDHWYNVLDFVVCPAIDEGSGRVLLESMSSGVLVLASHSGGHGEVIENEKTGYLIQCGNVDLYANTLLRVMRDENLYSSIVMEAHTIVHQCYSNRRHVSIITKQYEKYLRK